MKSVLVIEDNQLLAKVIEKEFKKAEFEIHIVFDGQVAIELLKTKSYDLVITDLNLPNKSGIDIINFIRLDKQLEMPIIVMSSDEHDSVIVEALSLGADDYLVKPAGLNQLMVRAFKLLKMKLTTTEVNTLNNIQMNKTTVGIVIPCYNEEERLQQSQFIEFVNHNTSYHLCFVNDGSKDNTLKVLQEFSKGHEEYISVYNCEKNGGKAEAVRLGVNYLINNFSFEYVGFLDADLSTDFHDFENLIKIVQSNKNAQAVCGSRIERIGANIAKESSRAWISKGISVLIQFIIRMPFQDTQCGAKIFTNEIAKVIFDKPFLSRWLFDIEIFIRIRKKYGSNNAKKLILEQPLERWVHMDGSKLNFSDSLKIFKELWRIYWFYR